MLTHLPSPARQQGGYSLIEVLITVVILAFGLLGLAGLQSRMQVAEFESYQRAQALLLLSDMTERINANRAQAASYASDTVLGTGDTPAADCATLPAGSGRDLCEWSKTLQGAAEKTSANVGAMLGARGCITQIQAANPASGVCTPGIYQIAVAWQGMVPTAASSVACGQGDYGDDTNRRVLSTQIVVGLPSCL